MRQIGVTLVIVSLTIISCGKKISLTEDELSLNPYKFGEALIFQSNLGKMDTIIVDGLRKGFPDAPGPLKYYDERLHVTALGGGEILELLAKTPDKDTRFFFHAIISHASFCCKYFDLDLLNQLPEQKITIKGKEYNDVIMIQNDSAMSLDSPNFVKHLFWSKKHGYVRFDVKNGETWSLIKKYEVDFWNK